MSKKKYLVRFELFMMRLYEDDKKFHQNAKQVVNPASFPDMAENVWPRTHGNKSSSQQHVNWTDRLHNYLSDFYFYAKKRMFSNTEKKDWNFANFTNTFLKFFIYNSRRENKGNH